MEKRVKKNSDYWFDIIFGGFLTFIILYFSGNLILSKLDLEFLNIYYFLFCVIIVIFYQWKDDNFEALETNHSKNKNFDIAKKALERLDWNYEANSTEIKLSYNKYILNFLDVSIIPQSEKIQFNFKYHSTTKTGRLPFYFGISTFLKFKFKKALKSEINKKPNG
jgi:Ca2+/Na+ antiporter